MILGHLLPWQLDELSKFNERIAALMPWSPADATRHTKKATTPKAKRAFAHASNSVLERTGDEVRAIKAGDVAAAKSAAKSKRK